MNRVIAGDYLNKSITTILGKVSIMITISTKISLDRSTVVDYEVITDEHRKSARSGIARGIIGGALLGPVGLLAGSLSGKKRSSYTIAIRFRDGKNSLIEINDNLYKILIKSLFK